MGSIVGNIPGILIRYLNFFPLVFDFCVLFFLVWRRHPSVCRLKGSPHRTKGHPCKNQGGVLGISLAQKLGSVGSPHPIVNR